jgi:hypothetical protein
LREWVAHLNVVVDHDAVFVVDNLGFVAELNRLAEAAFSNGTSVGVVE